MFLNGAQSCETPSTECVIVGQGNVVCWNVFTWDTRSYESMKLEKQQDARK